MKLTTDQINLIIFAFNREIDLERMGEQEIVDFAKNEGGCDPCYINELQAIIDKFNELKAEEVTEL